MVFQPSMDPDADDGFYALVECLLDDIFNFASLVPRVTKHKEFTDYLTNVEEVSRYSSYILNANFDSICKFKVKLM